MVAGLVVTHIARDPFGFTNAWELILKEVDIARFNFCHATIRVFLVHHIPFGMYEMFYEHNLSSSGTMFSMFMGCIMHIARRIL